MLIYYFPPTDSHPPTHPPTYLPTYPHPANWRIPMMTMDEFSQTMSKVRPTHPPTHPTQPTQP